jgi:phosphoribosylaminoimidazolecarboxamide formyltransferase/IMP cyclohydrolase
VASFERPGVAIIKHTNPCGVALADHLLDAWEKALAADPVSAFGGIVALNRPVDAATAEGLASLFLEVIVAPGFEPEALAVLEKKGNLRLIMVERLPAGDDEMLDLKTVAGGVLVQARDTATSDPAGWTCPTSRTPSDAERAGLDFAWRVVRQVRSNAIVITAGEVTAGIGAGQTSRVGSVELAARQAASARHDGPLVLASDAFFPFADGIERAAEAGVTAVIQPGGSVRDAEVIEACDRHAIAMLLTGRRHFKH